MIIAQDLFAVGQGSHQANGVFDALHCAVAVFDPASVQHVALAFSSSVLAVEIVAAVLFRLKLPIIIIVNNTA